jgi:hypothetical protein
MTSTKHSGSCLGYICTCDELVKTLRAENARYREALEFIAEGDIAPSSVKYRYIDEAYQQIASKALKGGE